MYVEIYQATPVCIFADFWLFGMRVRDQQNWADFGIFPSVPEYHMSWSRSSSEGQKFERSPCNSTWSPISVPDCPTGSGGGPNEGTEIFGPHRACICLTDSGAPLLAHEGTIGPSQGMSGVLLEVPG